MTPAKPQNPDSLPKNRLLLGGAVFILGQCATLGIPLVLGSGLPANWKTFLSLLFFGGPEAGILLSTMILGKPGFNSLRGFLSGKLKRYLLPKTVSRTRYRIGLVLFLLPLLHGWLSPYFPLVLHSYQMTKSEALVGDLLLIVSLFVLGGDFWEKLRALFIWKARVTNTDN